MKSFLPPAIARNLTVKIGQNISVLWRVCSICVLILSLSGCRFIPESYDRSISPDYRGPVCLYLGKWKGSLDVTLQWGSWCDRARISNAYNRTNHYVSLYADGTRGSDLKITVSEPLIFGSLYNPEISPGISYSSCQRGMIHSLDEPIRNDFSWLVAGSFLVLFSFGAGSKLTRDIQTIRDIKVARPVKFSDYRYEERIIPINSQVTVVGQITTNDSGIQLQNPNPTGVHQKMPKTFIITRQTPQQLVHAQNKSIHNMFLLTILLVVVGGKCFVFGVEILRMDATEYCRLCWPSLY